MGISNLYSLHALNVDLPSTTQWALEQIENWNCNLNEALLFASGSGIVDPTAVTLDTVEPRFSFTSTAVKTLLDNIGISGLRVTADVDEYGVIAYLKKRAIGSTYQGAGAHGSLTVKAGMLALGSITAGQGRLATGAVECAAWSDGTNAPIVATASQSLPSLSPATSELFTVGPIYRNGSAIGGVQDVSIDLGLSIQLRRGDGEVYPTQGSIYTRAPRITFTTLHAEEFCGSSAIPITGLPLSGSGTTKVFLRKCVEGGGRVADGTAEHILFQIYEGMMFASSVGGAHGDDQAVQVTIYPTWNGTNDVFVIDTTAAIA